MEPHRAYADDGEQRWYDGDEWERGRHGAQPAPAVPEQRGPANYGAGAAGELPGDGHERGGGFAPPPPPFREPAPFGEPGPLGEPRPRYREPEPPLQESRAAPNTAITPRSGEPIPPIPDERAAPGDGAERSRRSMEAIDVAALRRAPTSPPAPGPPDTPGRSGELGGGFTPDLEASGHGPAKYAEPDYASPKYADPDYAGPEYAGQDYAGPEYADSDYAAPEYGYAGPREYATADYAASEYGPPGDHAAPQGVPGGTTYAAASASPIGAPTAAVNTIQPAQPTGPSVYHSRRPALAAAVAVLAVLLEIPALRLLVAATTGNVEVSAVVAGTFLVAGLPPFAWGLYGLLSGAAATGVGWRMWARPPLVHLPVGVVLFLCAALAA